MPKVALVFVLLILASIVACGGLGGLSIDDYAEECADWEDDFRYDLYDVSDFEDALHEWKALRPPGEVKALHDLRTKGLELGLEIAKEQEALEDELDDLRDKMDDASRRERRDIEDDMDDLRDDADERIEDIQDDMEDLRDDYDDAKDDLPRSIRRDLEDEDCDF